MAARTKWAEKINAAWRRSVEAILDCARHLKDAQIELGEQEFTKLVEHELTVGRRTVQRLLVIADDTRLATHVSRLPPSWGTLHALARVPDAVFEEAIADGRINCEMTRAEAESLLPHPQPAPTPTLSRAEPPRTLAVRVETPDQPVQTVALHIEKPEQAYPPEQTPPSESEECAIVDTLDKLASLIGTCNDVKLARLIGDTPGGIQTLQRITAFMSRIEFFVLDGIRSSALH